jgi:hypothetical protein
VVLSQGQGGLRVGEGYSHSYVEDGFMSSRIRRCVLGRVVSDVSEKCNALILEDEAVAEESQTLHFVPYC